MLLDESFKGFGDTVGQERFLGAPHQLGRLLGREGEDIAFGDNFTAVDFQAVLFVDHGVEDGGVVAVLLGGRPDDGGKPGDKLGR